jgi:serine/threonine protein kinase
MQESINNQSMLKVGTILHGTYRIDNYLSSGGFGNTYVATNIEFDERVAIKEFFMKGVTQRDDNQTTVSVSNSENTNSFLGQKEKFKKEARRLRKMQNEHLVRVHDLFDENGTTYYVMDYVDGENLSEWLKRTGRPMTDSEVRLILPQILDALKAVHNEGFCHLDIKPSNIMLEKGGKIKLIDFGASKQLGANGALTTNAPTAFAQTPGYAPREQMEQNLDKIGPWTDIYALGATLYNLLTNNKPPLPTDIDDDMSEDKHNALPFPESVGEMKYLVLQMMKTNRLQRPQSIDAIISAEKTRKEEPKQTPKSAKTSQPSSYDDEATIIAEPKPKKERKTEAPKPKPKESDIGYSQTPPKQETYTSSRIEDNGGGELSKNTIILMVGALLFAVLFVLYHVSGITSFSATDQEPTPAPTETTVQKVERMQYTTCPDGNHPHMIDLGLPSGTKWACCNLGASTPEQSGNYYRWGETNPFKEGDTDAAYPYKNVDIGNNIAGTKYDAATANWGASWRMPTENQMKELMDNCTYKWTTLNGVEGAKVTGRNGGKLFFPASGPRISDGSLSNVGSNGYYWSASAFSSNYGYSLYFDSGSWDRYGNPRAYGFPVRAVAK